MQWLVCIDTTGILQQFKVGKDISLATKKEKSLENQAKVIFTFDKEIELKELIKIRRSGLAKEMEAWNLNMQGYNMRKSTFTDYIEILADVDATNYSEFTKEFSGLRGAINLLLHTIKVMRGGGNPGKTQWKWIEKLELEIKQREE